jgi:hypothetical protein
MPWLIFMANVWPFLAELFFKLLIPFGAFMAGKEAEKSDATEEALRGMRDAKAIDDRVERDPAYRDGVRNEYK